MFKLKTRKSLCMGVYVGKRDEEEKRTSQLQSLLSFFGWLASWPAGQEAKSLKRLARCQAGCLASASPSFHPFLLAWRQMIT